MAASTEFCISRRIRRTAAYKVRATSTRYGVAGMGTILPRISTGPWVSYASRAWGMTSRGRRREVLSESRMRGNLQVRFDERGVETELRRGYSGTARRKGRQQTTQTYCYRATSRLYRTATVADQTARVQTRRSLTGQLRPLTIVAEISRERPSAPAHRSSGGSGRAVATPGRRGGRSAPAASGSARHGRRGRVSGGRHRKTLNSNIQGGAAKVSRHGKSKNHTFRPDKETDQIHGGGQTPLDAGGKVMDSNR